MIGRITLQQPEALLEPLQQRNWLLLSDPWSAGASTPERPRPAGCLDEPYGLTALVQIAMANAAA